jgi:hypothetical protein
VQSGENDDSFEKGLALDADYRTGEQPRAGIFAFIENFYNDQRPLPAGVHHPGGPRTTPVTDNPPPTFLEVVSPVPRTTVEGSPDTPEPASDDGCRSVTRRRPGEEAIMISDEVGKRDGSGGNPAPSSLPRGAVNRE